MPVPIDPSSAPSVPLEKAVPVTSVAILVTPVASIQDD